MPLSGHLLTFFFTCITDLALVPPLVVMNGTGATSRFMSAA